MPKLHRQLLQEAHTLLADRNLVWSGDFERIRPFLAAVIDREMRRVRPRIEYVEFAAHFVRPN